MGVTPQNLTVSSEITTDPQTTISQVLKTQGVDERRLPASWTENGKFHVGSSAVHLIPRASTHVESGEAGSPRYNPVAPKPIIASGSSEASAWANYAGLILSPLNNADSCLRLETPKGSQFVRYTLESLSQA